MPSSHCLRKLLAVTIPQTFLVLGDLEGFEGHWSGILQKVPSRNLCEAFLMISLGL